MTEAEWLASNDPSAMLRALEVGDMTGATMTIDGHTTSVKTFAKHPSLTDRKLRLFACACCLKWKGMNNVGADYAEQHGEQYGLTDHQWAQHWCVTKHLDYPADERCLLLRLIFGNPFRKVELPKVRRCSKCNWDGSGANRKYCDYGSDPQGKYSHNWKVTCPWFTPDVLAVAQGIYDNRDASGFGELWDALEEAGCRCVEIENALKKKQRCPKCLGEGAHGGGSEGLGIIGCLPCDCIGWLPIPGEPVMVRGFWPIDLLLGKE